MNQKEKFEYIIWQIQSLTDELRADNDAALAKQQQDEQQQSEDNNGRL